MNRPAGPGRIRWSVWAPIPVYLVLVFAWSLPQAPFGAPRTPFGINDKVAHFFEYGGLAALVVRAVAVQFRAARPWEAAALGIVFAVGCGALDEWVQSYAPLRTSDMADLVADSAGALVASIAAAILVARGRRRGSEAARTSPR